MFIIKNVLIALFTMLLLASCATKQTAEFDEFTGYLGDYSKLKEVKDELGNDVLRWQSDRLKPGVYTKVILDPIVFYPEPKATPQVSHKVLNELRDYANTALRREVSKVVPVTHQPGPKTLTMRLVVTGVATKTTDLAAYEYIPIAAVAAGAATATGMRDRELFLVTETELVDSRTGTRLFIEVFKRKAEKLLEDDVEQVTLDTIRGLIDHGAEQSRKFFEDLNLK
jgi:hypothetical protein